MRAPRVARIGPGAAVLALAMLVVSGCGTPATISPGDVEQQIADSLATSVGGEFGVACPAEIPAQQGYQFTCDVQDHTGAATVQVIVTEDDDQGAYSWRVAGPPASPDASPSPSGPAASPSAAPASPSAAP